ncbi:MAG: DMT family transporter [Candidatus Peregrinibacteria bacterium]|nr:DMT family transporter [Candidatus Peregrinibacteria bacterium]
MWLLFAILAPLCWGFANPVDAAMRRSWVKNDFVLTSVFALVKLPVAIGLMIFFGGGLVLNWPFFWMFTAGIIWMLAFVFYYKAMQLEEVSRVVLILQFQPIMILLLGMVMIGETLNVSQIVAFVLILTGSVLAAFKKKESKWHFSQAFVLVLIADVLWSVGDVMFKKYVGAFPNFWSAFSIELLGSSLLGGFIFLMPKYRAIWRETKLPMKGWNLLFVSAIFGTLGSLFFAYALTLGKAALTSVIVGLQPLFALISGLILHRFINEIPRDSVKKEDLVIKGMSFLLILMGFVYLYF